MNFESILQLLNILERVAALGNTHPNIAFAAHTELNKINADLAEKQAKDREAAAKAKAEADAKAAADLKAAQAKAEVERIDAQKKAEADLRAAAAKAPAEPKAVPATPVPPNAPHLDEPARRI
jgi:hypothetical protein